MTNTVTPPIPQPWDTNVIASRALGILRLAPDDPDATTVELAAITATGLLDAELDGVEPMTAPLPPAVDNAAVFLTVEIYRRKDAPFGVLNAWSVDDIQIRIGPDVMRHVRSLMLPYKERFGVA